jgi:hypothetical protein
MNRIVRLVVLFFAMMPAQAIVRGADQTDTGKDEPAFTWGGEIRFHGGALNSDEGFGRTGGSVETRLFLDASMPAHFKFFAEVGSGNEQGADDPGLERLYVQYSAPGAKDFNVSAGWIRLPFGRWDAFTLSRPLVKDRQFFNDSQAFFQLRRTSAGVGLHDSIGPFEIDLAYVSRAPTDEFQLAQGASHDAVGRLGYRHAGFSAGVSYLQGFGDDRIDTATASVDLGNITSCGLDLELSRGAFTFGGEGVIVDIDGRTSRGYYLQGSYDLSSFARGLRLLGKYDVLHEDTDGSAQLFRRVTLGARYSLRRDLDLDLEIDQDYTNHKVRGFGGSHLILGLRYRF